MISSVHHTALFVTSVERSIAFYTEALGLSLISRSDNWGGAFLDQVCGGVEGLRINIALVTAGDHIIELIEVLDKPAIPTDENPRQYGIARIGFEVADIEDTVSQLRSKGVRFLSDIVTVDVKPDEHYSDGKAIKFQDPDGIILELQQPPRPGVKT